MFCSLILFSGCQELKNIQDSSIVDKVLKMRRFIEMAFQALTVEERSRAKFNDFGMDGSLHEFQLHPYTLFLLCKCQVS